MKSHFREVLRHDVRTALRVRAAPRSAESAVASLVSRSDPACGAHHD